MLIENKLGGHVIFTLVSVMAKSGPLKKIDCLNIVLPYVESHSELLSRLELRVGILLDGRCASRISSKFSPAPENA